MSLPSPLPCRQQKKGLFKHPPPFPFFSLSSFCLVFGTFVCLHLWSQGPQGKGHVRCGNLGMGSQPALCPQVTVLGISDEGQAACGVLLLANPRAPEDRMSRA